MGISAKQQNQMKESRFKNRMAEKTGRSGTEPVDFIENAIDSFYKSIERKKKEVFINKLKEEHGIVYEFPVREVFFPMVGRKHYPDREEWYYNDGTENGKLIVTFLAPDGNLKSWYDEYNLKFAQELKYF